MEVILLVLIGVAIGYGLRGLIAKEAKAATAELKTVLAELKLVIASKGL